MLALAGGDSRVEMTSTPDDAELLKDLRGLGKPPLIDGNDTDLSVTDTAIGEMANPRNQHIEMPQIQYTC